MSSRLVIPAIGFPGTVERSREAIDQCETFPIMNTSNTYGDELLRRMIEGDDNAFGEFCATMLPEILSAIRSRCHRFGVPPDLARDFVQEALLRTVERFDHQNRATVTVGWFVAIAKNKMLDWLRKERRHSQLTDEQFGAIPASTERDADLLAVLEDFHNLAARDKEILTLVLLHGHTPAEAAPILGIGEWSAYKRYERALGRLRDLLKEAERQ